MRKTFDCPLWNSNCCDCPDGSVRISCPGHTVKMPARSLLERIANAYAYWSDGREWPVCIVLCGCIVVPCVVIGWVL